MSPQEFAALQAIDATIMQLQALKLSLMTAYELIEEEIDDTPIEGCLHENATFLETMGRNKVCICPDCEEQFEVES